MILYHVIKMTSVRKFSDVASVVSRLPAYRIREAVRSDVPVILKYITVSSRTPCDGHTLVIARGVCRIFQREGQ